MAPTVNKCAVCRRLRRKCPPGCVFFPHFPANDLQRFEQVHRVYGSANVGRMLQQTPSYLRARTANALCVESQYRMQDPILGSAGVIFRQTQQLQEKETTIANLQAELSQCKLQLSRYEAGLNSEVIPAQNLGIGQPQWPKQDLSMPQLSTEQQWSNHSLTGQGQNLEQVHWISQTPPVQLVPECDLVMNQFQSLLPTSETSAQGMFMQLSSWPNQAPFS